MALFSISLFIIFPINYDFKYILAYSYNIMLVYYYPNDVCLEFS